jgi:hypothetical protein
MKRVTIAAAGLALVLALATAAVFAVWAGVGDAPWESEATCARPSASPCPSPSQEETEKVACLQGAGTWEYFSKETLPNAVDPASVLSQWCGPQSTGCWACVHRVGARG